MAKYIDPKSLGLPSRTTVEEIDSNTLAIVIQRKSRIIMADGKKILTKAAQIESARPGVTVVLKTTTPICSKTLKLFEGERLEVIKTDSASWPPN
jgi:hypothetical protein